MSGQITLTRIYSSFTPLPLASTTLYSFVFLFFFWLFFSYFCFCSSPRFPFPFLFPPLCPRYFLSSSVSLSSHYFKLLFLLLRCLFFLLPRSFPLFSCPRIFSCSCSFISTNSSFLSLWSFFFSYSSLCVSISYSFCAHPLVPILPFHLPSSHLPVIPLFITIRDYGFSTSQEVIG